MATLCQSGLVILKAGVGVHADIKSGVVDVNGWIEEAEAQAMLFSRYDWVINSGLIVTNFEPALQAFCGNLAAIHAVKYDMTGYASRIEAEDLINVLRDEALRIGMLIRNQQVVKLGHT